MIREYDPDLYQAAAYAAAKTRKTCRKIARQHMPMLPDDVIARICNRKKLYNFLEALDLSHAQIQAIFWQHNLAVPRDRKLQQAVIPADECKPEWLENISPSKWGNYEIED